MSRSLAKDLRRVVSGKRVFVGTTCDNPGPRRLARDTGFVLFGKRVFVGAECRTGGIGRAIAKRLRLSDGRLASVGACCPAPACCADHPLPDSIPGTVTAYGWDVGPSSSSLVFISENPITLTKTLCTAGEFGGEYAWIGDATLSGCDEHGPCGVGGSGQPGCAVSASLFCTSLFNSPFGAQWFSYATYGDFTSPIGACEMGVAIRSPVTVVCDPLCIMFFTGTPIQFGDTTSTCRVLAFRFGDGCASGSGSGASPAPGDDVCPGGIAANLIVTLVQTGGPPCTLDGTVVPITVGTFDQWSGTTGGSPDVSFVAQSSGTGVWQAFPFVDGNGSGLPGNDPTMTVDSCGPFHATLSGWEPPGCPGATFDIVMTEGP